MALECDPPHLGDIGDREPEPEPDLDLLYEKELEQEIEERRKEKWCQTLDSGEQSQLDLVLANYTNRQQRLKLSLLREDGNGSEEPVLDGKEYTVPAPESDSDTAGNIRETAIAPERRYLVRVQLRNGRFERFHTHYHPAGSTGEEIFIGIRRDDKSENLFVDFRSV